MTRRPLALVALWCAGCLAEPAAITPPPILESQAVAANLDNVLSAIVTARTRNVDSLVVHFGTGPVLDRRTPAFAPTGESTVIPVLGLVPETAYGMEVVAYGGRESVTSARLAFTTGALPADLPSYTAEGSAPSPGYVAFAAGRYGIVIDNTGRVVWYHAFPQGPGLNFQAEPTGRYVARPPISAMAPWVEIDIQGRVTRAFGCANGMAPRFHDLIAEPDGGYWIMCDQTRVLDLTTVGGLASVQVTGTVVQHISATGALLFEWTPFGHLAITDLPLADRSGSTVNWTHGNALDLDTDGNLIVSFRALSELTKIDTRSGAVLWRMGGLRNQFTFEGAPTPGFARQHGLRVSGAGQLSLLDNLGDSTASRAERYAFDGATRTVRLLRSFGPDAPVVALLGGTTQSLPGGHLLVAFGNGGRVQEYDSTGAVVWEIDGNAGYIFRAQRIWSLYFPGVGSPR